jgi:hypothetical protein
MEKLWHSFSKWHVLALIIILYALVALVTLVTHQPPETTKMIFSDGAAGVGTFCLFILFVG